MYDLGMKYQVHVTGYFPFISGARCVEGDTETQFRV